MKRLEPFSLDRAALRGELAAFQALLTPPTRELSEKDDILPFFKSNRNLGALIGLAKSSLSWPDVLKSEFSFVGDCACDLAIGQSRDGHFCFVEFEDARRNSIFQRGTKGTPDWATRLEHGFSQIVDWFYVLADITQTKHFRNNFGTDLADWCGRLVIGRDAFLNPDERDRLRWRSLNTAVAGKPVSIVTFDELCRDLTVRVDLFATEPPAAPPAPAPSKSESNKNRKKAGP